MLNINAEISEHCVEMLLVWGQHAQGISVPSPTSCFPNSAVRIQEHLMQHLTETLLTLLTTCPTAACGFNHQHTNDDKTWPLLSELSSKILSHLTGPSFTPLPTRAWLSSYWLTKLKELPPVSHSWDKAYGKSVPFSILSAMPSHSS